MADEAPNPDETPITFNVKSSSEAKYVLTVPLTTTVLDLKSKLSGADYADIPPDRQRLIYSGRVLKDADTLATYKIKEGNTVHLVKGAQSNVRQNPANASGASATAGGGATATGTQGVPANLASGTGRDPLAGLTGARYAGHVQLPNANMFGPDGGMGPPPDPEHMASMLENPNFQSTLSEALSNPEVIDQMIRSNPMLRDMGPQVRQMMQDPSFRRMMTDPEAMRNITRMQNQFGGGMFGGMGGRGPGGEGGFPAPGVTDTTEEDRGAQTEQTDSTPQPPANPFAMFGNPAGGAGAGAGAAGNPFAALFGPGGMGGMGGMGANQPTSPPATGEAPAAGSAPQQDNNPFASMARNMMQNPQMMQQMLGAMGGGSGGGMPGQQNPGSQAANPSSATNAGFNPFAAVQAMGMGGAGGGGFGGAQPEAPRDDRAPEDRYASQLGQLNDMGFYEFERNVEALRRTGGSVQGAVEYLLTHP